MQSVFIDLDRVLEDMKLYEMQSDRKSIESITLYVQFALLHLVRPSPVGGFVLIGSSVQMHSVLIPRCSACVRTGRKVERRSHRDPSLSRLHA